MGKKMKKKYLSSAVAVTFMVSLVAASAFAGPDADTLDGLDSKDFAKQEDVDAALATKADQSAVDAALATKADQEAVNILFNTKADQSAVDDALATKADQSVVDAAVANPVLPVNYEKPYTCEAVDKGAIVLTSLFTTCVCNGTEWVLTADGKTTCEWRPGSNLVTSAGQVWMDRNLGASRVATSSTDSTAYGDLYQWGRGADGHQLRTSSTTYDGVYWYIPANTDDPGHGGFIVNPFPPHDWRMPSNENLWKGVAGTNNPCPPGFRLPTSTELDIERTSWISDDAAGAFASPLKLPMAGQRDYYYNGDVLNEGSWGNIWSSTAQVNPTNSVRLSFSNTLILHTGAFRAEGMSVRCIQD